MSVFIPPPGAMQFEVTHPKSTVCGEVFWVMPIPTPRNRIVQNKKYQYHTQCKCTDGFEIYMSTCSPEMQSRLIPMVPNIVCECVGKIIG